MDDAALDRLRRHFEEHPDLGVISVYLFGSHAERRAHRESDVDVAILLDRARHPTAADRFEMRVRLGSDLAPVLRTNDVDLVILNDAPPLFGRRIVYDGKRIFCSDPDADREFVRMVQLQAIDLEPWWRKMQKMKLEALAR